MYLIVGKDNCNMYYLIKNLLDGKGIGCSYFDREDLPQKTTGYLKMYCTSHPMILKISHFKTFPRTKTELKGF